MKRTILAALLTISATAALAEPECTAPVDGATAPVWEAIKVFEDEGGVVKSFKVNDGNCFVIFGTLDGTNMAVIFDPTTGAELDRIAA